MLKCRCASAAIGIFATKTEETAMKKHILGVLPLLVLAMDLADQNTCYIFLFNASEGSKTSF